LNITHLHALAVDALPNHHRDPFGRMLIAQALEEAQRSSRKSGGILGPKWAEN
jgi:PIN domain nuclease of toxin-antitoxin system